MNVPITAARQLPSVTSKASRPTAVPTTVGRISERGRGAWPSRWRTRPPRTGMPAPTTTRATTMTMSGTSSNEPVWGSQECCAASDSASDWSMPMAMPATTMGTRNWNRPTTAAANAGTTNSV
jgi:hypothetical protein